MSTPEQRLQVGLKKRADTSMGAYIDHKPDVNLYCLSPEYDELIEGTGVGPMLHTTTGEMCSRLYPDMLPEHQQALVYFFHALSRVTRPILSTTRFALWRGGGARDVVFGNKDLGPHIPKSTRLLQEILEAEKNYLPQNRAINQGMKDASATVLDIDLAILPKKGTSNEQIAQALKADMDIFRSENGMPFLISEFQAETINAKPKPMFRITGSIADTRSGLSVPIDLVYLPTDEETFLSGARLGRTANSWDQSLFLDVNRSRENDGIDIQFPAYFRNIAEYPCWPNWDYMSGCSLTNKYVSLIRALANETIYGLVPLVHDQDAFRKMWERYVRHFTTDTRTSYSLYVYAHYGANGAEGDKIEGRFDCIVKETVKLAMAAPDLAIRLLAETGLMQFTQLGKYGSPTSFLIDRRMNVRHRSDTFISRFTLLDPQTNQWMPYTLERYLELQRGSDQRVENTGISVIGRAYYGNTELNGAPLSLDSNLIIKWLQTMLPDDEFCTDRQFTKREAPEDVFAASRSALTVTHSVTPQPALR